jgi:type IV pilus assembly protein PilE
MRKKYLGFTLMDLIVAVSIVGILTAISVPTYQTYVRKANRVDMQARMLQIAASLERFRAQNFSYNGALLTDAFIFGGTVYPQQGQSHYTLTLTGDNADGTPNLRWELTAKATGNVQASQGVMKLNSNGERCWLSGATATTCSYTNTAQAWN